MQSNLPVTILGIPFKLFLFYYNIEFGYFACLHVYALNACILTIKARVIHWIPWNWSQKNL